MPATTLTPAQKKAQNELLKQFQAITKKVTVKDVFDLDKIKALPETDKTIVVSFLVKFQMPIVTAFIPENMISWLHSMGYLYIAQTPEHFFLITCENKSKLVNIINSTI